MSRRLLLIEQIVIRLAATPPRIAALTANLSSAQLHTTPNPNAWSANDLLAHLRACADVWGNSIMVILAQDTPTIRAINPTTWIKSTDYREQDFHRSLQAFTTQRADLLAVLEPLAHASWSRAANVTGAGKPLERTVYSYAQRLVGHEQTHLKQFERIVKTLDS